MTTKLDSLLAPWVFVLTGILFNILSAVITHYFIGLNNDAINLIDRDIERKQVLIDSLWQSRIEVERKKEFFILLLATPADNPASSDAIYRDYLQKLLSNHGLKEFQPRMDRDSANELGLLLDISGAGLSFLGATELTTSTILKMHVELSRFPVQDIFCLGKVVRCSPASALGTGGNHEVGAARMALDQGQGRMD